MSDVPSPDLLPETPNVTSVIQDAVRDDYLRLTDDTWPSSIEEYLADRYQLDIASEYAGCPLKNPWGKASGQLSMTARQVEEDVEAGLGFVVLKTVIAQDAAGDQSMDAWAIKEIRMLAEPIVGQRGDEGWTISWKGRGWWQTFDEYLDLVRNAQRIARGRGTLIVPSCKYHLPTPDETEWRRGEYEFTTRKILAAWQSESEDSAKPMPLEKDFSPTLAGSDLASQQAQILDWLLTVPRLVRDAVAGHDKDKAVNSPVRLGLKLFNALFDDEFQLCMLDTIHEADADRPDFFIYGNRLFDPKREFDGRRGIAYGGPDLSDRNLRVMSAFQAQTASVAAPLSWSATGNIVSGKMALEYALRGASSFQLHTFFQLPSDVSRMTTGSKVRKALHELYFHPRTGFIVWMHHLAGVLGLPTEMIRLRDIIGCGPQLPNVGTPE
jgi:hypothetical protein